MAIQTSLRRNWREVVARCWNWAYWGEDPTGIAANIACLNGESVLTLPYSATQPTPQPVISGQYALIGTDGTSANNVVLPNGATVPTGKTFTVTDAGGLIVGGNVIGGTIAVKSSGVAAAAAVSRTEFIADAAYQVTGVQFQQDVASASGTVAIEKLTGTQAPGGGTTMLTGAVSTAGTANTVLAGTLVGTAATLQLAAGNRIGLVFGGTATGLVGLAVTITLKRI